MNRFYPSPVRAVLLVCMLFTGFALSAQFAFPVDAGPFPVVAGTPTTIVFNDAANSAAVPASDYLSFTLTVEWEASTGDPWSSEAEIQLITAAGTVDIDPATLGAGSNGNATTLTFSNTFAGVYDPSVDGSLSVDLGQSFSGSVANWSNLTLTISDVVPSPPATVGTITVTGCDDLQTATNAVGAGEVQWYEVITDGVANDQVIFDTEGSLLEDTEIGVYDENGFLLDTDDDGGSSLLSSLSLDALPAGTYYVAVGGFNMLLGGSFNVTTTETEVGDVTVNVATTCTEPVTTDIEFCVDYTCVSDMPGFAAQQINFADGPFMGFQNLTNTTGDVWCGTFALPAGEVRYSFFFAAAEGAGGLEVLEVECASEGDGGVRRTYTVVEGAPETVTFAWEQCEAEPVCPTGDTDVEFCVDYSCVSNMPGFAAQQINFADGPFMGFQNLTNTTGDVWCGTFALPAGEVRYSFFFAAAEGAGGLEELEEVECASEGDGGVRRTYTVVEGAPETVTFAWEQCEATPDCGVEGANVEFCVDVSCLDVTAVSIFGNNINNFGFPGIPLADDDEDGIFCTTLNLPAGDTEYKFVINNNEAEEFEIGTPGTITCCDGQFTNRLITVEDGVDQEVTFGFNASDEVCVTPPGADVEFCVDIGCIMPTGTVNVFGIFPTSFFDPFANPMMDEDGDGIYCTTVFLEPGDTEFKFIINPGQENEINENFMVGDDCTVSCCDGAFTNRIITVEDGVDQQTNYVFDVPCESTLVEPVVDFPALELQCVGGETVTITGNATPEGGEYSGDGVTDNGDGTFDIVLPATGDVDITYTFEDDLECEYSATSTLSVDATPPTVEVLADPFLINLTDAEPEMTFDFEDFVSATDDCDIFFEADRPLTFGGADIGEGSFTITVRDANGNDVTVTINFVVTFDQPNLACRGAINLTLNDECQGLVIPSMVLTGNTSLIDFFMFDIVVQDEDPSNGPIIDGCGEFIYTISERTPEVAEPISGFTGPLAGDNWDTNADDAADWSATFTSSTLTLVTGPGGTGGRLMASYMFSDPGSLSFDYTYNNVDIGTNVQFDEAIVIVNFEGATVEVIENGATEPTEQPLTGSPTVDIQPGYSIVFGIDEDGFAPLGDAADLASELIVSNLSFAFAGSENLLALDFETCWGTVTAEDKTPPAIDTEIGDIELLCVDLDENRVDVLPNTVDRCYEVFSATGATVPNTMATALRNALSANTIGNGPAVVPTFTDGCTERLEVCVSETVTFDAEDPECNDVVITRTFTATEIAVCPSASGETNPSTVASYVITFTRPSLDDLDGDNIEATAVYDRCTVNTSTSTTADIIADYPAPRSADFPFLFTEGGRRVDLVNGESVCGFAVSFADGNPTITCEYGYKFVRTYTVLDWCAPGDIRTFTQVVKVGDTEAPTFTGPTQDRDFDGVVDGDLIYTTNAGNSCAAYIILDGPGVGAVDNCSDEVTITATIFPGADLGATAIGAFVVDPTDGNAEVTSAIPVGTHLLRYTYTDDCGNTDFSDFIFTVEDGTAPVAICEDQLNVSISSGQAPGSSEPTGIAILTPEMIDAGSYDDCTGVTLLIALEGTDLDDYSDELILTCADLGTIQVSLRVEDENGNVNTCWLDVLVEDKNIPTCIPPGPMTITCIEYNESLPADISEATEEQLNAAFGSAVGIDNCEVMISSSVSGSVNSCGVGQLIRSFEAEDGEGFTDNDACMQSITIRGIFDYTITFPTDEESGCADIPAFDGLATEEFACDLITTDITIDTIAAVNAPEACFTLRVNYDVINYCEYNQLGECYRIPRDGDGIRNPETQLLYLNVIPNSTVNTEDDIAFLSRFTDRNYNAGAPQRDQLVDDGDDNDGTDDDNSNDSEDSQAANGIGFAYAQDDSRGFFCYIQYVDVYDEDAPTIEGDTPEECFAGSSADCTAEVTLTFTADDECTMPVVTGELDANYIASAGFIPTRNLTSEEVSNDGVNYTVNLSDIPVGNHAIRIRANDGCGNFDVEVIEFCVEGDKAPTPICIQTLTVTLMPDGNGGGMAEIWASDFIASDVEDCFGNVIDKYSIYTEEEAGAAGFEPQAGDQGVFFDCDDFDAENVPVRVYAIADNGTADYCSVVVNVQAFQEGLCDDDGGNLAGTILTQHEETVEGVEVTLTGDNDMDMMATTAGNGSYTFTNVPAGADYTVQPFHAAAVNLNEVTVGDVNLMGSVILGLADFATSYDYLAADVDGDRSLSVGDMVSVQRVILGLDADFGAAGNWGFVPADVDVSNPYAEAFPGVYNVNDLVGNFFNADFVALELGNVNAANRSSASIEVEDAVLEAGQSHVIVLSGAELAGFQGTLELAAGLEVVDVTYEGEGGLNLNGAADGVITMMFLADATVNVEVRATEAGLLSELVALTSDVTVAEGVNLNGTAGPLSLNFTAATSTELVNNLEQNAPNPVADVTKIGFTLATAGEVTLTIQDIAGRTVSVRELSGIAGRNVVELNVSELGGATGVLSYTVVSGDFSATKKMVVVR